MHKVLSEIKEIINKSISEYLPDVQSGDLEENGNVYYMNGKNGTEFDWYVNDHISDLMVFYNDEANLGAVKLTLYTDGKISIYVYGDKGNTLVQTMEASINITEQEMLNLVVILKKAADDKRIFDRGINEIDSDIKVSADDNYLNDIKNIGLAPLGYVCDLDPDTEQKTVHTPQFQIFHLNILKERSILLL